MASTRDALGVVRSDLPRAFIDASVLMAATLSTTGSARELFADELRGRIELVASPLVLRETERNLYRKAPHGLGMFLELCARLAEPLVEPPAELIVEVSQHIELKDAPIVAGAITAGAGYLVSYDRRHLLSQAEPVQRQYRIAVVTPDVLLVRLADPRGGLP